MDEINRVTAVTPGALTALALLSDRRRGIAHEELVERCRKAAGACCCAWARASRPRWSRGNGEQRCAPRRSAKRCRCSPRPSCSRRTRPGDSAAPIERRVRARATDSCTACPSASGSSSTPRRTTSCTSSSSAVWSPIGACIGPGRRSRSTAVRERVPSSRGCSSTSSASARTPVRRDLRRDARTRCWSAVSWRASPDDRLEVGPGVDGWPGAGVAADLRLDRAQLPRRAIASRRAAWPSCCAAR